MELQVPVWTVGLQTPGSSPLLSWGAFPFSRSPLASLPPVASSPSARKVGRELEQDIPLRLHHSRGWPLADTSQCEAQCFLDPEPPSLLFKSRPQKGKGSPSLSLVLSGSVVDPVGKVLVVAVVGEL